MAFQSISQLLAAAGDKPLWQAVLEDDCRDRGVEGQDSLSRMTALWAAMKQSVADYDPARRSASGLSGGQAAKMEGAERTLCGPFLQQVMATALKVGEHNACMGRIVAAPTAGASGVMPAVLIPLQEKESLSDESMVQCLYVAAGFGQVISARASISGAEGGCQAEVGSAAAMAAAALVFLMGGTGEMMANACAMAVKNLLGLVCDPVGGLVEVPCVKRNVIGAMDALSAAQMALAGITSRVPPDQVLDAMREVGDALPHSLKETGKGGLAATPFGKQYAPEL